MSQKAQMPEANCCTRCGAELPRDAPGGHCIQCLLQLGMAAGPGVTRPPSLPKEPADLLPTSDGPGQRIGRYKLLEEIGEGGCGVVYMAEQEEPVRRRVALKVIKPGMDTRQVVARFEAERQALALMDHPNIARVFDGGTTEGGRPYFVMELVCGVKITDYCDQNQFSTRQRLDLFLQVCQAIQHAHQKGVIHRDIKPSNILVTELDGVPVPKVIDFGIAKATGQAQLTDKTLFTAFDHFMGTPAYMSPEQAGMGKLDVDTRSDIYSLGVLLYELLTGQPPFNAAEFRSSGLDEVCHIIKEKAPLRPSTRVTKLAELELMSVAQARRVEPDKLPVLLRRDLDWIVMKCLEKDRKRRYETVNGLAMDLQRYLASEPVVARPATPLYRFQKSLKRNKLFFFATAAVLLALILGLGASTWMYFRERRAHDLAVASEHQAVTAEREQRLMRETAERAQADEAKQRQRAEAEAYASDMNLVEQAWEQDNVGRVRELLAANAAYPDRGFEWYYWQHQTHLELETLRGHTAGINSVAFFPDGQRVVTASDDRTAKVWDLASGNELFTLSGHSDRVMCVATPPDGRLIVTGSRDGTAKLWDSASGRQLRIFTGHRSGINSVAFSPNGQRIVTGSSDRTAKVWDVAGGQDLLTLKGDRALVACVAFSPDGRRIVTGSWDHTARIWDAASGKELLTLRNPDVVCCVAFFPDGQLIITGGYFETAEIWDVTSRTELRSLVGHRGTISSVAFSRDGTRIVTGNSDGTARVFDTNTCKELAVLKGHGNSTQSVAFSPDGHRIITGSWDGSAKVWETPGENDLLTFKGHHDSSILSVACSPDSQRIVTGNVHGKVKVWEFASGQAMLTIAGNGAWIKSVAFSPDGRRIAAGCYDRVGRIWDATTGRELLNLIGHSSWINSVAFDPDGRQIVSGSSDHTAKIWDAASGNELFTLSGHSDRVMCVATSPDGGLIATGSRDETAKLWNSASGRQLRTFTGHRSGINSVAFSPNGLQIATGSDDGTAGVWDVSTGKERLVLNCHEELVEAVSFSPDGLRLVTGSQVGTATVWDLATGEELLILNGHTGQINSLAFCPNGQRIVTGGEDGMARVWEAATPEQVSVWQAEEQAAAERLTLLRRQQAAAADREQASRAKDPGAIKQWLLLAPIPYQGTNGVLALNQEQIPHEADIRVRAGDRSKVGAGEVVWTALQLPDYIIVGDDVMGEMDEWSIAYAVCYIQSEKAQEGLVMRIGSDDESKIYLNGKEIYRCEEVRPFAADEDLVPAVALKSGINVLVFKIVNEGGGWGGSVRFEDSEGQPVKGISITLTPP